MEQSILISTKKVLQIGSDDDSFDLDIMTHINSAFSILNDLGVGPEDAYMIEDEEPEWGEFTVPTDHTLNLVKTFVFLNTRMLFDPPGTTFHMNAVQEQLKEVTWRLSVKREGEEWVDPDPPALTIEGTD
jgi:hypothetical protein